MTAALVQIRALKKYYPVRGGWLSKTAWVKAVDGVDLDIIAGETMGLVGESGCGKTTLVNTLLRLEEPTAGQIQFDGRDISRIDQGELRRLRKHIQIVFQDPFWSLNPRLLIRDIIGEPFKVHEHMGGEQLIKKVEELLEMVGLSGDGVFKYPHEFSGGQRQRIAIARALALSPKLVVLDEPTSSIDVLSQAQILELLKNLKEKFGLTYILISHDLSVVHYMSDRITVMYLGKIAEYGAAEDIFNSPAHPYTRALLAAIPSIDTEGIDSLATLEGSVPSAVDIPGGCRFHPRCSQSLEICGREEPPAVDLGDGHVAVCHLLSRQ
jgi:oligopeptide/dipeptide ABC transporter ATP-binding protein